jgi:hypothetical protein
MGIAMDDNDETLSKDIPPYLSPTTFQNFVDAHRRTLPTRIDRSIMSNLAGGDQVKILRGLRFFNLIDDDGHPTDSFKRLSDLDDDTYQSAWSALLRQAYPDLFSVLNLEKATQAQIEERFREAGIKGDTVRKAVAFFVGMARMAGIPLSPYFKGVKKRGPTGPRGPRKARRSTAAPREETTVYAEAPAAAPKQTRLHPAVQAWIDELPGRDDEWNETDFTEWLTIFEGSIRRAYKLPKPH